MTTTGKALQSAKDHRMMADDEAETQPGRFLHHIFRAIQADQGPIDLRFRIADVQASVIVILLQGSWCPSFEGYYQFFDAHLSP
jgi:hypothetical protein